MYHINTLQKFNSLNRDNISQNSKNILELFAFQIVNIFNYSQIFDHVRLYSIYITLSIIFGKIKCDKSVTKYPALPPL